MAEENENDNGEKTEEPSAHRIEEFRKKGDVASSKELTSVLVLASTIFTLALTLIFIYEEMSSFMEWAYSLEADKAFQEKNFAILVSKSAKSILICSGPVLLVSVLVGVLSNLAQVGFLFAPEVLTFNPQRIDPIQGFKRLFTVRALVEAIKGVFKFIFVLSIVYIFMQDQIDSFGGYLHLEFFDAFLYGKDVLVRLGLSIVLGLTVVALGDFAYQKLSYRKKLMMTKEQAKREHKEQDGNPEIKQRIRNIQKEMSQKRMMNDVPKADVIVTNPTHISVAIQYDDKTMVSPTVVAKGSDEIAMRIREIAKENEIPIVENVELARTLYKTVKIGNPIPRTLYKAVAEVLAFVYRLRRKNKALR